MPCQRIGNIPNNLLDQFRLDELLSLFRIRLPPVKRPAALLSHPAIAIAQMTMRWSCEENTETVLQSLSIAREQGAQICVFPELALTGFHQRIRAEAVPARIREALRQVQAACREYSLACVIGAPTFQEGGAPLNSHIHIDEYGEIAGTISKSGLTPSEKFFFAVGLERPIATLHGITCTSVLCREVEDLDSLQVQLGGALLNVIFWPSFIGRRPGLPGRDYLSSAQELARRFAAHVIQCNWPNELNFTNGTDLGKSAVISDGGELLFELPTEQAGVATFVLGEREYTWLPTSSQPREMIRS